MAAAVKAVGLEAPVVAPKPKGLLPRAGIFILISVSFGLLLAYAAYDIGKENDLRKAKAKKAPPATIGGAPSPDALARLIDDQGRQVADAGAVPQQAGSASAPLQRATLAGVGPDRSGSTPGQPAVPAVVLASAGTGVPSGIDMPLGPRGAKADRVDVAAVTAHAELQARMLASTMVAIAPKGRLDRVRSAESADGGVGEAESKAAADMKAIMGSVPSIEGLMKQFGGQRGGAGGAVAQPTNVSRDSAWVKEAADTKPAPVTYAAAPVATNVVLQGTRIPAVTLEAMNSDLPGQITARSTEDLRDSLGQTTVLVPAGTRFVGSYNAEVSPGQSRVLMAFTRMILPDGRSVELHASQATDAIGQSGITGNVDNHFLKMYAYSLAVAISGERLGNKGVSSSTTATGQVTGTKTIAGEVLSDISKRVLDRNSNIPPTITTPIGERIYISITRDIALAPWKGQPQ